MKGTEGLHFGWGLRLPMMLQTEAAECGLACVAMIASYFGYSICSADLRRRFGLSLRGATLKDLVTVADQIGLASRPVRLEMDELHLLSTTLALWKRVDESARGSVGNDKESQAEQTAWR